jgi:hypothetical protein
MENFDRVKNKRENKYQGECGLEPGFKGGGPEVAITFYCKS